MISPLDPPALPAPTGNYAHGTLVTAPSRLLFVSGQVAWAPAPPSFEDQCRAVWANVLTVLAAGGMGVRHLAKVTTYLADRRYREANSRIRQEVLGDHRPALTIIICDIYAEEWLLEIDAIAADLPAPVTPRRARRSWTYRGDMPDVEGDKCKIAAPGGARSAHGPS